jgi:hypothetical protein
MQPWKREILPDTLKATKHTKGLQMQVFCLWFHWAGATAATSRSEMLSINGNNGFRGMKQLIWIIGKPKIIRKAMQTAEVKQSIIRPEL